MFGIAHKHTRNLYEMRNVFIVRVCVSIQTFPIFIVMFSKAVLSIKNSNDTFLEQNNYQILKVYQWNFKLHSNRRECRFKNSPINTLEFFFKSHV